MAEIPVDIQIRLQNIEQSLQALQRIGNEGQKSISKVQSEVEKASKSFIGFGGVLNAASSAINLIGAGASIIGKVADALAEPVKAAIEAENSLNSLNTALALAGNFSRKSSEEFQALAAEIQRTTTVEDDAVLSTAALIQNMTKLSGQALKDATKASIELSAALKIDLDTASRLVSKAAEGNVEAFKRYGIEIRKGKDDTESFANTLEALSKFNGSAAAQANTFGGALQQLSNNFGDVLEEIGGTITNSQALIQVIQFASEAFSTLSGFIKENSAVVTQFISTGIRGFVFALSTAVDVVGQFVTALAQIRRAVIQVLYAFQLSEQQLSLFGASAKQVEGTSQGFKKVSKSLDDLYANMVATETLGGKADKTVSFFKRIQGASNTASRSVSGDFEAIDKAFKENTKELDSLVSKYKNAGLSQIEIIKKTRDESLKQADDLLKKLPGRQADIEQLKLNIIKDSGIRIKAEQEKQAKETADILNKSLKDQEKIIKAQRERLENLASGESEKIVREISLKANLDFKDVTSLISSGFKQLEKGAEGAKNALTSIVGVIVDQYIPGLGSVVREILNFLAAGPEKVKEYVDSFAQGITDTVDNIVASIPQLFTSIIENIGPTIDRTLNGEFFQKFADGVLRLIDTFIGQADKAITAFSDGIPRFIEKIVETSIKFAQEFVQRIPSIISAIIGQLPLIIDALVNDAPRVINTLVAMTPVLAREFAKSLIDQAPNIAKGIGDALLQSVKDSFKNIGGSFLGNSDAKGGSGQFSLGSAFGSILKPFAEGGVVPPGYPNDSYPARLTSGEVVLPTRSPGDLDKFLARNSSGGGNEKVMSAILVTLTKIESKIGQEDIIVNVGGKELVSTLREQLKSGRVIA